MLRSLNVYHQISMNYTLIVSQYKYFSSLKYMSLLHLCVCVCTHVLVPTLSAMTHGQRTTLEVCSLSCVWGHQTQIIRVGNTLLYQLSHLASHILS